MSIKESKIVKDKKGTRIFTAKEDESPFLLTEPNWVPNARCTSCPDCKLRFTAIRSRHLCRRCGLCFCDSCCKPYPLNRMAFVDSVLQCYNCIESSRDEFEFFQISIPFLQSGADLFVENYDTIFFAKLAANHQIILLTDPQNSLHTEKIALDRVESVRETCVADQCSLVELPAVEKEISGFVVLGTRKLNLVAVSGHQRFISQSWLKRLVKALKVLATERDIIFL